MSQEFQNIRNFTLDELKDILKSLQEPPYRADQIFRWLYKKGVEDFLKMTDLPEGLRNFFSSKYTAKLLDVYEIRNSKDGTRKFLFKLHDNNFIESVLIPDEKRNTICVSTQMGCKFGCAFCASGKIGFVRNLEVFEILSQILFVRFQLNINITNIVFMGMGEPFDNYDNVIKAIKIINEKNGLNMGARKIIVSTCGLIPEIKKFADIKWQVRLSVSLHATDDKTRSFLMPVNKKYSLSELLDACSYYVKKTGRRITFEYILIDDINDSENDMQKLVEITKQVKADINIIPFSRIENSCFKAPSYKKVCRFADYLKRNNVKATIRKSKGSDIDAACGQLAGKKINE